MGLAERRGVKNFQDTRFPELKKQIDEAAGFEVEVAVDWDTLAEPGYAHLYEEAFPKVFFIPIIEAFKGITFDDLGRDALRAGLKKVLIKNSNSPAFTFENGLLTVDYYAVSNVDYWEERKNEIQKALENGL